MDYKETIKERIQILPEQLKTFVLAENWRKETEKVGTNFSFDEEKYTAFENEVFLVLLGFEPKNDLVENIKRELEIDADMAGHIAEELDQNIFSKVADELNSIWQSTDQEEIKNEPKKETPSPKVVAQSFEEIILNQARAMQPAREAGSSSQQQVASSQVPKNLPTEQNKPKAVHNYIGESDPYREPLE